MSTAIELQTTSPPLREPAARWRAVGALLRRDLVAGRRGSTVFLARVVVLLVASGFAVQALVLFDPGQGVGGQAGGWNLVLAVGVIAMVMTPILAMQTVRSEREQGTFDLLMLTGLDPITFAFGRTLSTFLLLESLLLEALPAIF